MATDQVSSAGLRAPQRPEVPVKWTRVCIPSTTRSLECLGGRSARACHLDGACVQLGLQTPCGTVIESTRTSYAFTRSLAAGV